MRVPARVLHVVGVVVALALVGGLFFWLGPGGDDDTAGPAPVPASPSAPLTQPPPATPSATAPPATPAPTLVPPSITIPPLPSCPAPAAATPLRVVSFNIHGGRSRTTYDLDGLIETVRSWDADVVMVQEVHRFRALSAFADQPALMAERLGMSYVFGRTYTRPPEGPGRPTRESGNLVLSRLPVLDHENIALPRYEGQEPRALLRLTIDVGGQPVRFYDTHFQHTSGDIRIVQARAVRDAVAAEPGPFVLAGDFNATPESQPLTVLGKVAVDPWPVVGTSDGLTVPAREPRRRIDYVMHGGAAWVARQAQTALAVSDHRAVLTDLELPAVDPCAS